MTATAAPLASLLADWGEWLPDLAGGLWTSVRLGAASLALGLPLGLLAAIGLTSGGRGARIALTTLVELARGVPVLVLIYLAYFGLPRAGITLEAFAAATVAIGLSVAGYSSETFRAGLLSVGRGQRDAAAALGLTPAKQYRLVIVPQAIRIVLPPLVGLAVQVVQLTALAFTIGLPELLGRAYNLGSITTEYLGVLLLATVLYLAVLVPLSQLAALLARRAAP
ncbi:amino acid ABC transporter permease [Conexibacter stalactiti]|uniref:Amino acid ABC transporter permease n=1 Tax=Conexibacter stalactiti TaxID=1940611 RepID=A0ABU4HP32_9ACTN|nr:amino acid ABC transporter permease [Conexibacter stalactiti]MDW5595068.1 amino acid ABC transporter permease [Conexibacter stalactiti]MEC5035710.1 amino acid ABC transporter permease [Conexibacter stalactiti]